MWAGGAGGGKASRATVTLLLALCAPVAGKPTEAHSRPPESQVAQVKENLLYHIARLTHWPARGPRPDAKELRVCVLGKDREGVTGLLQRRAQLMRTSATHRVDERVFTVRSALRGTEPGACGNLRRAHLVYFADAQPVDLVKILKHLRGSPSVTVGQGQAFLRAGGMIALVRLDARLRLHVRLAPARLSGLRFGAQLLQHAHIVDGRRNRP